MTEQQPLCLKNLKDLLTRDISLFHSTNKSVNLLAELEDDSDLSWHRVGLIKKIISKIYESCGWNVNKDHKADLNLLLTLNSVSSKSLEDDQCKRVVVGVVRNIATKQKERDICFEDYLRMREEDILSVDGNMELAKATVEYELLSKNTGSCVNLDFSPPPVANRGSSNRGVVFCLYNYARIATILRKHEECVIKGTYPPLPSLDDELLGALSEMKPEQELVKVCLQKFSQVLKEVAPGNDKDVPRPHLLCRFLSEISHPISRYYRSHHVLTEGSAHLLPTMHARLHVLKAIHRVLLYVFILLDLQPQEHI